MATLPKLTDRELEQKEAIVGIYHIEPISREMHFVAKLLFFGGWELVKDYHTGVISHKSAQELVDAAEMVWREYKYLEALNGLYASSGDSKTFNKGMKHFTDRIKVE